MIESATFVKSSKELSQCPDNNIKEFAFIGRSNVGKSSLINMLTGVKGLAKTSGKPGKTQSINHFIVNESWYLVDLPGYGYASVSKRDRKSWVVFIDDYILKRRNLVNLYLLIDSRLEPQKKDLEFIEYLGENAVPFTIVFTKIDKLNKNQLAKNIAFYNKTLNIMWEVMPNTILSSSEKYVGKEELLAEITELLK